MFIHHQILELGLDGNLWSAGHLLFESPNQKISISLGIGAQISNLVGWVIQNYLKWR